MNRLEELLLDNKLREDLVVVLNEAINNFQIRECFWAVRNIENGKKDLNPEAKRIFEDEFKILFLKVKWVAAPQLSSKEVLDLLQYNLLIIKEFSTEVFHLTETIKHHLAGIILLEEQDKFKIKVREALLANNEAVDNQAPVKIIGAWLRDIIAEVGLQLTNRLKESEYYLHSKNFSKLKKEDQEFLKGIINLYKYCLYSSQTPEGFDQPITIVEDGRLKVIEYGQIMDIPSSLDKDTLKILQDHFGLRTTDQISSPPSSTPVPGNKLYNQYHQLLAELVDIKHLTEIERGSKQPNVILDELNNSLAQKDLTGVVANLEKLIEVKCLSQALRSNYFNQTFGVFVEMQFGPAGRNLVSRLSPQSFNLFLKFLLVNKLQLGLEKSAVLAIHLANKLAKQGEKQFLEIAYADSQAKTFKWREVKEEGGQLKFV